MAPNAGVARVVMLFEVLVGRSRRGLQLPLDSTDCRFTHQTQRAGCALAADQPPPHCAPIVRITRRYDVSVGLPLSSTARMTCAVPATRGVTVRRDVDSLVSVTRGGG